MVLFDKIKHFLKYGWSKDGVHERPNFSSSDNPSTGITSTGLYNGTNSILTVSGTNGYATGVGNSIAIGNSPLVNGFAAQVTAVNFANANSLFNFELTWTKTGLGMATTTTWTIS